MEREMIVQALAESPTLEDAAQTLGINASTLWRKRKRYKIE
jgi:NtrC-family two-component system response regulator AlgB